MSALTRPPRPPLPGWRRRLLCFCRLSLQLLLDSSKCSSECGLAHCPGRWGGMEGEIGQAASFAGHHSAQRGSSSILPATPHHWKSQLQQVATPWSK